ncbi:hypothetical protein L6164_017385 [Bauhinia variegata]|uniref:Uncharacterized protein n=1 Tax=Bauhinia variegata TaxID=167791 RepID=A0ACB9NCQ8_BAUVA|nr:hypothetical protein L6164_017385 [Bauhinia variegata]
MSPYILFSQLQHGFDLQIPSMTKQGFSGGIVWSKSGGSCKQTIRLDVVLKAVQGHQGYCIGTQAIVLWDFSSHFNSHN